MNLMCGIKLGIMRMRRRGTDGGREGAPQAGQSRRSSSRPCVTRYKRHSGQLHLKWQYDFPIVFAAPIEDASAGRDRPGRALPALVERSPSDCEYQVAGWRDGARMD